MRKNIKGIWLYGKSGSGKSFISNKLSKKIKNSFIIDGDEVRKLVSSDLGYNIKDRTIQNLRVLGIAKIAISNKVFPIISSVFLSKKSFISAKKNKILILNVVSEMKKKINQKLKNKTNVVGKDLHQPTLNSLTIINKKNLKINIENYVKQTN